MPTNINPLTASATTGVVTLSSTGAAAELLPSGSLQFIGNNGSGLPAVSTMVAGTNMSITQSGANFTLASSAASGSTTVTSWVSTPSNYGSPSTSFTIPVTQTATTLTATLAYAPTLVSILSGFTQTIASASSVLTATMTFNYATDCRLNNQPLTIVFAVYLINGAGTTPTTGQLPMYTYAAALSNSPTVTGTPLQYFQRLRFPVTGVTGTQYSLMVVPYFYVPSGSTLSGTNMTAGSSAAVAYFTNESNQYDTIYPATGNYLLTDSLVIDSGSVSGPFLNTTASVCASGALLSFGSPSVTGFNVSVPIFVNALAGSLPLQLQISVVNGTTTLFSALKTYNVSSVPYVIDTIEFWSPLNPAAPGQNLSIQIVLLPTSGSGAAYISKAGLPNSASPAIFAEYGSCLTSYSSASGPISLSDQKLYTQTTAASAALSTTVQRLNYSPSAQTWTPLSANAANLVDTLVITANNQQSQLDVTFNFTYTTNAYSTLSSTDLPVVTVLLVEMNGATPAFYFGFAQKIIPATTSGRTTVDTVSCFGRINVLSTTTTINAYAFVCTNSNAANISVTSFASVVSGGSFSGAGCNWVAQVQSLSIGGGTSTASSIQNVTAASGSYITASTSGGTATIGTTQASTSQAGLLALNAVAPANTIVRVDNTGTAVASPVPYYAFFGGSLVLNFGGASVGVTYTARSGVATIQPGNIPIAASNQSQPLFDAPTRIVMSISSKGSSTGNATLTGLPVVPFVPSGATNSAIPILYWSGINVPNNNNLVLQYVNGSSTLTFVLYPFNGGAPVILTNTAFTAPITFEAMGFILTTTAPTN